MIALAAPWVLAHVPGYACFEQCCRGPPDPTISSAFYLRVPPGTLGGLEYHIRSDKLPFDIPGAQKIDWDAVFKKEYDPSTFALRVRMHPPSPRVCPIARVCACQVGCGGCFAGDAHPPDQIAIDYKHGTIEPCARVAQIAEAAN